MTKNDAQEQMDATAIVAWGQTVDAMLKQLAQGLAHLDGLSASPEERIFAFFDELEHWIGLAKRLDEVVPPLGARKAHKTIRACFDAHARAARRIFADAESIPRDWGALDGVLEKHLQLHRQHIPLVNALRDAHEALQQTAVRCAADRH